MYNDCNIVVMFIHDSSSDLKQSTMQYNDITFQYFFSAYKETINTNMTILTFKRRQWSQ